MAGFPQADFYPQTPLIASAEYKSTPTLGPSGEKEGPYDWVPPNYWYDTTHLGTDSTVTNVGGPGATTASRAPATRCPTLDSLNRFMSRERPGEPVAERRSYNQYHPNYEPRCKTGYSFGTLFNFDTALTSRYGPWSSLASTSRRRRLQNYENTRAQFEAFLDHCQQHPAAVHRHHLLADEQGLAEPAVEPLQQRRRPGRQLLRRAGGEPGLHALYALDNGTRHAGQPDRRRRSPGCPSRRRSTAWPAPCWTTRPARLTLASQQVPHQGADPEGTAATARHPAQVYFVRAAAAAERTRRWTATSTGCPPSRTWSTGPRRWASPQATMTSSTRTCTRCRRCRSRRSRPAPRPPTAGRAGRRGPGDHRDRHQHLASSTVAFLLRADVRRGTAGGQELPGDNELQLLDVAAATTSRCSRASRRR